MTGNSGDNVLSGGTGNDNYNVDNAGDVVTERRGRNGRGVLQRGHLHAKR